MSFTKNASYWLLSSGLRTILESIDSSSISSVVEDTSPELGGDLHAGNFNINNVGKLVCAHTSVSPTLQVTNATTSNGVPAIMGIALGATGSPYGVYGLTTSQDGRAVVGTATHVSGSTIGIYGKSSSSAGQALRGEGLATSGVNYGVVGTTASASGFGGWFENTNGTDTEVGLATGTDLLVGSVDGTEKFSVDEDGNVSATGDISAVDVSATGDISATGNIVGNIAINDQTGATYTFVLADNGRYVRGTNAGAQDYTVPPNSTTAFPIGTQISLRQAGAGQITLVAGSGVTINTAETLKLRKQGSTVTLIKVATNEWDVTGDLEAA